MALLLGDMKEEDAWRDTMPLVRADGAAHRPALGAPHRARHLARLRHQDARMATGYRAAARTRSTNTPPDLVAFRLLFKKARTRTPANRLDFADASITLSNDQWTGVLLSNARGKINESLTLKFYEALMRRRRAQQRAAYGIISHREPRRMARAMHGVGPARPEQSA